MGFLQTTGFSALFASGPEFAIKTIIMLVIACVLLYLAIAKKFEPLLLLPIAFGMLLSNLPMFADSSAIMMHPELFTGKEIWSCVKLVLTIIEACIMAILFANVVDSNLLLTMI